MTTFAVLPSERLPAGDEALSPQPRPWRARTHAELVAEQLAGIEMLNRALRDAERAEDGAHGREARMDLARRMEALRRQHQAVIDRADEQLRASGGGPSPTPCATALVVHRNAWFVDRVTQALGERGIQCLGHLDNGADGIGRAVADQPDLLLVEEPLPMVSGEQVTRDVLRFSPSTLVVAQVPTSESVGRLLDAGATAVYTRRVPPQDVAAAMLRLMTDSPARWDRAVSA